MILILCLSKKKKIGKGVRDKQSIKRRRDKNSVNVKTTEIPGGGIFKWLRSGVKKERLIGAAEVPHEKINVFLL